MKESISISVEVEWYRPNGVEGPWKWGARKDTRVDRAWSQKNVIYRWVRASDGAVAVVGETERLLTERVDNYIHANAGGGAGATNKRLNEEARRLMELGDYIYVEITTDVPGYDLSETQERRFAECLITAIARPYLK